MPRNDAVPFPQAQQPQPKHRRKPTRDPPPVADDVAGPQYVAPPGSREPFQAFRSRLGNVAFVVWACLVWNRNTDGTTRIARKTVRRLVNRYETTHGRRARRQRAINAALRRLNTLGLITSTPKLADDKRDTMRVLGDWRASTIRCPLTVAARINALRGRGGARPGAGRPKGSRAKRTEVQMPTEKLITAPTGGNQKASERIKTDHVGKDEKGMTLPSEESCRAGARRPSIDSEQSLAERAADTGGSPVGRSTIPRLAVREMGRLVPPMPHANVIAPPMTPPPPRMQASMSDDRKVRMLLAAYRGAVKARTGKECWVYAKSAPSAEVRAKLIEGAAALVERDIAPAAWAAFSVAVWSDHGEGRGKAKTPPLVWVFGAKRVHERAGWYAKDAASYTASRLSMGPLHRHLWMSWQFMHAALRMLPDDATRAQIATVVERHFPRGWRAEYEEARDQNSAVAASLRALADAGEWIW